MPGAAFLAAGAVVAASPLGVAVTVAAAGAGILGVTAWARRDAGVVHARDLALTLACAAAPAAAATGPVLLRRHGLVAPLVLVTYALVYDAGAWVIGFDARRAWLGPAAGVACVASVTLTVAALFPQFKGLSAWELGGLAALLAPLGPRVAVLLVGDRAARVPALARLDVLVLLGPAWALAAASLAS